MKAKKLLALLLAASLVVSITACEPKSTYNDDEGSSRKSKEASEDEDKNKDKDEDLNKDKDKDKDKELPPPPNTISDDADASNNSGNSSASKGETRVFSGEGYEIIVPASWEHSEKASQGLSVDYFTLPQGASSVNIVIEPVGDMEAEDYYDLIEGQIKGIYPDADMNFESYIIDGTRGIKAAYDAYINGDTHAMYQYVVLIGSNVYAITYANMAGEASVLREVEQAISTFAVTGSKSNTQSSFGNGSGNVYESATFTVSIPDGWNTVDAGDGVVVFQAPEDQISGIFAGEETVPSGYEIDADDFVAQYVYQLGFVEDEYNFDWYSCEMDGIDGTNVTVWGYTASGLYVDVDAYMITTNGRLYSVMYISADVDEPHYSELFEILDSFELR